MKAYKERKSAIAKRLVEFKETGEKASDKQLFSELAFCLLTPQSKARSCDIAIKKLLIGDLLFTAPPEKMAGIIKGCVRFHNNKARYIAEARSLSVRELLPKDRSEKTAIEARNRLAGEVKGLGMKEAGHFLRNVGYGDYVTILDRHIIRNLARYGAIPGMPKSLSRGRYLEIEEAMKKFAKKVGIPLSHIDILFWSEETGEIFK